MFKIFGDKESKMVTYEDAIKTIKTVTNAFIGVAMIQFLFLVVFLQNYGAILDALVLVILSLILKKFPNMLCAVLLFLLSLGGLVVTAMNKFGMGQGGKNIYLALLLVVVSIKGIKATWLIRKLKKGAKAEA